MALAVRVNPLQLRQPEVRRQITDASAQKSLKFNSAFCNPFIAACSCNIFKGSIQIRIV